MLELGSGIVFNLRERSQKPLIPERKELQPMDEIKRRIKGGTTQGVEDMMEKEEMEKGKDGE